MLQILHSTHMTLGKVIHESGLRCCSKPYHSDFGNRVLGHTAFSKFLQRRREQKLTMILSVLCEFSSIAFKSVQTMWDKWRMNSISSLYFSSLCFLQLKCGLVHEQCNKCEFQVHTWRCFGHFISRCASWRLSCIEADHIVVPLDALHWWFANTRCVSGPRSRCFRKRLVVSSLFLSHRDFSYAPSVDVELSWNLFGWESFVHRMRDGVSMKRWTHNSPIVYPIDVELLLEHRMEPLYQTYALPFKRRSQGRFPTHGELVRCYFDR